MLQDIPNREDMILLIGESLYKVWEKLCIAIDDTYDMEHLWNTGGKKWTYEYKYRRGGKTLCALYAREKRIGFMVIFGKDERAKFEVIRSALPDSVCKTYDEAEIYHDGKWVMFEPTDTTEFNAYLKLLMLKRKPNRK